MLDGMTSDPLMVRLQFAFLLILNHQCHGGGAFFNCFPALVKRRQQQQQHKESYHLHKAAASKKVNEGVMPTKRGDQECDLACRAVRPMSPSSRQAAPIVVLHGGPSVPSDCLHPLADHTPCRSIVFYDQIGCGRSEEPADPTLYSIDQAVDDLEALLKRLGVRRFHLHGQSFGGILAFEYLKRLAKRGDNDSDVECSSAIFSSTPTNVTLVEQEANRLISNLSISDDEEEIAESFRREHQCRTPAMPQALADAYARAGTVWRGTDAISDYVATPPSENSSRMRSCMVMRGEHDFVTEQCVAAWKECFNHKFVRFKTLEGCSHYGLLENGPMYGELVDSCFHEFD